MKLFRTNNIGVVKNCQSYFGLRLPSELRAKRVKRNVLFSFPSYLLLIVSLRMNTFMVNKNEYTNSYADLKKFNDVVKLGVFLSPIFKRHIG